MNKNILFLIYLFLQIKCNPREDKYYFQLYPSQNKSKPNLFHAYIPPDKLYTFNTTQSENCYFSTDNKNCSVEDIQTISQSVIRNLSSVILFNDSILIKTCFSPDYIVEIINEKNETLNFKKNNYGNNIDNIKYCYSTAVFDPKNSNEYAIITYWTEFEKINNKITYKHKSILYYPKKNIFSDIIILRKENNEVTQYFDNFYPENCITFRSTDIYCNIHYDSNDIFESVGNKFFNSFIIETKNILESRSFSLTSSYNNKTLTNYQKIIGIDYSILDKYGRYYDSFLTEIHNKDKNITKLVSSLFRKSLSLSYDFEYNSKERFYGVNIVDKYIDPNLFNHILLKSHDLILIYLMKTGNNMSLLMTIYNLNSSNVINENFIKFSLTHYIRDDICKNPKYMQSILVNSVINYNEKDKDYIKRYGDENSFYKYQKDIVSLITCLDEKNEIFYQSKKINMLQCLNILDEINGKDYHIFKFDNNKTEIIIDIYNDPKYISLRNVTIEFLSLSSEVVINYKTSEKDLLFFSIEKGKSYNKIRYLRFTKSTQLKINEPISIPYRLSQSIYTGNIATCHHFSEDCKLQFSIKDNMQECPIPDCLICDGGKCIKCKYEFNGINISNCKCNIDKGFILEPITKYGVKMCICKENYVFYKDTSVCMPMPANNCTYEKIGIDDISLIPIYDDAINNNCPEEKPIDQECLNLNTSLWFNLSEYKFYYARIFNCIYVFDSSSSSLFFYSNRIDCLSVNEVKSFEFISFCLNRTIKNKKEYEEFLNNSLEYNPYSKNITIFKKGDNIAFYLVNNQTEDNVSDVILDDNIIEDFKEIYNISEDLNLLVFKADITRNDTISTQVEYQFYNPTPSKIHMKLDFSKLKEKNGTLRSLDDINLNTKLMLPIHWKEEDLEKVEELFKENIFLFNTSHPFYTDVCFKYTTPSGADIYLDDRKKKYFINEAYCEEGCELIDDNSYNAHKLACKCEIKFPKEKYKDIKFTYPKEDIRFKKKYYFPNIREIKCIKEIFEVNLFKKNFGFYFYFFLLLIFIVVHLLKLKIRFFKNYYNKPFEDLRNEIDKITEKNNGEVNIKNEDLLEHKYDAKKEKDEIDEEEKRIEAYKDYDDNEDVPLNNQNESNKNSKQFENKEKDSSSLNDKNNNLDQNTIYSKGRRIIKIDEISIKLIMKKIKVLLVVIKGKERKKGKKMKTLKEH